MRSAASGKRAVSKIKNSDFLIGPGVLELMIPVGSGDL